jgi:hypothetical protein
MIYTGEEVQQGQATKYRHVCPEDGDDKLLDRIYPVADQIYVDITKVENFLK